MVFDFTNQVALVTGGTSGIGLSTAQLLLKNGAKVLITGRKEKKSESVLKLMNQYKNNCFFHPANLSKVDECEKTVQAVISSFGKLDIVINSAGIYQSNPIEKVSEAEYDEIMNTNVKGTFFICKYAVGFLKKTKGVIVNISSDSGLQATPLSTVYCASKGAVTIFTKTLAYDLAKDGVRVNCVCPGDILTPMLDKEVKLQDDKEKYMQELIALYPIGRIGKPEEVAPVICFLASGASSFVTGSAWPVDGGITSY